MVTLIYCSDERVGNLTFVHASTAEILPVKSQVTLIVRGMYSNPPSHGARIVAAVLRNPQLYEQWLVNNICNNFSLSTMVVFVGVTIFVQCLHA